MISLGTKTITIISIPMHKIEKMQIGIRGAGNHIGEELPSD